MNVLTSVTFHTQEENGHSGPKNNSSGGSECQLARWCRRQREAYNNNILGQKEIELLEQVNFRFDTMNCQEVMWNKQYRRLVAFYVSIL